LCVFFSIWQSGSQQHGAKAGASATGAERQFTPHQPPNKERDMKWITSERPKIDRIA